MHIVVKALSGSTVTILQFHQFAQCQRVKFQGEIVGALNDGKSGEWGINWKYW